MFLYEWIIYEFQVSIYIEFNKNLLNIKHTDIIAIFFTYQQILWDSRRLVKISEILSEGSHSHSLSLQSCDFSACTFPTFSALRVLVISVSTSSYDSSCPRCWRQTITKNLAGRSVWILINSSSFGFILCSNVSNPRTLI